MAILNTLIVNGSSRYLQKAYFQDLQVSGTASLASLSLSGNLSVGGDATVSGTLGITGEATFSNVAVFSKVGQSTATWNNPALVVGGTADQRHLELCNDTIQGKNNKNATNNLYLNYYGSNVYLAGSKIYAMRDSTFVAPTANIVTVNAQNVNVTNNLRANHYDLQSVAQLGGSFYVSPTVKFPNSSTSLTVAKSGTTLTLTITDSSITSTTMAGIVWTANSLVKVSGTINGVVTGTMDGTITSINTSSHVLTLSVSGENSGNVVAGTYSASQFSDLSVMVYQRHDGSNDYRVGIWMNCYDMSNSSATIRIYGGTTALPNVMIGNLTNAGLGTVNNLTPTGWGLFAQNAFLHGSIVAKDGKIGGFTLSENWMYSSSNAPAANNLFIMPGGTQAQYTVGGNKTTGWVFTSGTTFGVTKAGGVYATSGQIGGFSIGTTKLSNGTLGSDSSLFMGTTNLGSAKIADNTTDTWRLTVGSHFGVTNTGAVYATSGKIGGCSITDGVLQVANANITALDAAKITSGTIAAARIGANSITADKIATNAIIVGTRNLLCFTGTPVEATINTTSFQTFHTYYTPEHVVISDLGAAVGDSLTISFDWETSNQTTYGNFRLEFYGYKSSSETDSYLTAATDVITMSANAKSGHFSKTWVLDATKINTKRIVARVDASNLKIKISHLMMSLSNREVDWTLSPYESGGFNATANKLYSGTIGSDNSVYISTANMTANIAGRGSTTDWRFTVGSHFGVTNTGAMYSTSGKIAGWTISADGIYMGDTGMSSNTSKYAFWAGETNTKYGASDTNAKFKVGHNGTLTATGANISGKIIADDGEIGGFTIDSNSIHNGTFGNSGSVMMCTGSSGSKDIGGSGSISGWCFTAGDKFGVTTSGALYSTSGKIGGFTIGANYIRGYNNTFTIYSDTNSAAIVLSGGDTWGSSLASTHYQCYSGSKSVDISPGNVTICDGTLEIYNVSDGGNLQTITNSWDNGIIVTNTNAISGRFIINGGDELGVYDDNRTEWVLYRKGTKTWLCGNGYAVRMGEGNSSNLITFMPRTAADGVANGKVNLGASSCRWQKVYTTGGVDTSSDERIKTIHRYLSGDHKKLFMELQPIEYSFIDKPDEKHFGLGAQTTEAAMRKYGFGSEYSLVEHAFYDEEDSYGRHDTYNMNYDEAAMLAIPVVQEHEAEIQKLKAKINELETKLSQLTQ